MRKMRRLRSGQKGNSTPLDLSLGILEPIVTPYGTGSAQFEKKERKGLSSLEQKRKKQYHHLCLMERRLISKMLKKGMGLSEIARELGRGKQAICSEVRRNGGRETYNAHKAQKLSIERKIERDVKCSVAIKTKFNKFQTDVGIEQRVWNLEMQLEILTDYIKRQKSGNE